MTELLRFAPQGPAPLEVLVVESEELLPTLRERLPVSHIHAVTQFGELADFAAYQKLDVSWHILDYRQKHLPLNDYSLDLIIGYSLLENIWDTYSTLMDFNRCLKETGILVADFLNVRYHKILAELKSGSFPYRDSRLYAKEEVVRMLNDALFKEIEFAPLESDKEDTGAETWEKLGFQNFSGDLSVKRWMLRAGKSAAHVAALKSLYTAADRRRLATLLRRIEYGVETEDSLAALWDLIDELAIFPEYLVDFISSAATHQQRLRQTICTSAANLSKAEFADLP